MSKTAFRRMHMPQPPHMASSAEKVETWIWNEIIWLSKAMALCTLGVLVMRTLDRGIPHFNVQENMMVSVMQALKKVG